MRNESKAILTVLIAISFAAAPAFAEPSMQINLSSNNIKALETVLVTGKVTGVTQFKPVKLTVTDPDGKVAYAPVLPINDLGEFRKLIQPTLPSFKAGTYTVTANHEETNITARAQFTVTSQEIPRNQINQQNQGMMTQNPMNQEEVPATPSGIIMSADAINGSDTITIKGKTNFRGTDITFVASSPTGNIVTIAQVTPSLQGEFEVEIKTGGAMWKEDGTYTITANQGASSEYKESINVEIKEGVVIPEFGTIAAMILAVAIISIIAVSAKSRLSIIPRY